MLLSVSVYAALTATDTFSISLPAQQGDTELPAVKKTTSSEIFWVFLDSVGTASDTFTSVMAWTESPMGVNYSDPTHEVDEGTSTAIAYNNTPAIGKNVVLNMDNPIYTTLSPVAVGEWTPN